MRVEKNVFVMCSHYLGNGLAYSMSERKRDGGMEKERAGEGEGEREKESEKETGDAYRVVTRVVRRFLAFLRR